MKKQVNKCVFCGERIWADGRKHIVQKARFEVWQKALGSQSGTPHFNFYLKNTIPNPSFIQRRKWLIN